VGYDISMSNLETPVVAYFSAEYAIADDLPIYAGGLGILAADTVLEAGSQNLKFYAFGLVYHQAFAGDDPDQRPMAERLMANEFEVATNERGERLMVSVDVADRKVLLQAWVKVWGQTKLVLLDASLDENDERDRAISDHLYAKDPTIQLAQEICLGFGGVAMLDAMGVTADVYHLNEGHSAMAGLAVVLRCLATEPKLNFEQAVAAVKPRLVGTKHTMLPGSGLLLDWATVGRQLRPTLEQHGATLDDLKGVATKHNGDYSDTKLMITLTHVASGVSKINVAAEIVEHPKSKLIPITNGIFRWRWMKASWDGNPLDFDDEKFWAIHSENRRRLLEHVRDQTGKTLDPERLTVVWARRMAAYKRPDLLVTDMARLKSLIKNTKQPIQFVVAGQANPSDVAGIELMNKVIEAARRPALAASFAYLPHYNTVAAKCLVHGADLWLNTPIRGFEACGTSGMKASLNGALQLSISDGWIDEVDIDELGWELPEIDPPASLATALYDKLERDVAPLFYKQTHGVPIEWVQKMRANMKLIIDHFTTTRMLGDYYSKLYMPSTKLVADSKLPHSIRR
jgi:starch phosphorylase